MKELSADVIIYGGSLGGTLAAYSAAKTGRRTFLFAESDWIGGQLTVQAVPPTNISSLRRRDARPPIGRTERKCVNIIARIHILSTH